MGIAGMVLGTVAVVFAFIPVFGAFIALPCIAVGLPLSAIAFFRNRRQGQGVGMAIAGMATNIAAIVIAVVWLVAIGAAVEETIEDIESGVDTSQCQYDQVTNTSIIMEPKMVGGDLTTESRVVSGNACN